ncbi:uncharacterized protein L203_104590 [Cryptococcus depauperatus CBS 7841]|uniref:Uncharacterized protein n=1 Tax=Cryptococcus depauperatus CBS 7841 TaxID=1295531 RepID=A0A1E3ILM7_9TREE|nr:hypothetical protein L203_02207 [Cryptococcus depauperatus CBS 7841]
MSVATGVADVAATITTPMFDGGFSYAMSSNPDYGPFYAGNHLDFGYPMWEEQSRGRRDDPTHIIVPVSTNQTVQQPASNSPPSSPPTAPSNAPSTGFRNVSSWGSGVGEDYERVNDRGINPLLSEREIMDRAAYEEYDPPPGPPPYTRTPQEDTSNGYSTDRQNGTGLVDLSTFEGYPCGIISNSMDSGKGEQPPSYTATATETPALPPRPDAKRSAVRSFFTGLFQPSRYRESTGDTAISRGPKDVGTSGSRWASGMGWLRRARNRTKGYSQLSSDVSSEEGTNNVFISKKDGRQPNAKSRLRRAPSRSSIEKSSSPYHNQSYESQSSVGNWMSARLTNAGSWLCR